MPAPTGTATTENGLRGRVTESCGSPNTHFKTQGKRHTAPAQKSTDQCTFGMHVSPLRSSESGKSRGHAGALPPRRHASHDDRIMAAALLASDACDRALLPRSPIIDQTRRVGGDAVVPAHLVLDALAPASLTRGRRPPPGVCAHGAPVPSREDEASAVARRTRRACSIPVSPARLSTNLRCFSNGCLVKIFVKRSAGLVSPGM